MAVVATAALAGCATVERPQDTAMTIDASSPRYDTAGCERARREAAQFDERIGERAGAGLALGFFFGPIALPIALAADIQHAERREEAVVQLRDACEGPLRPGEVPRIPPQMRDELMALDAQRMQGTISGDDYRARKAELAARVAALAPVPAPNSALEAGAVLAWRDTDRLTGVVQHAARWRVTDVDPGAFVFDDGSLRLLRPRVQFAGGRPGGSWVSGFDPAALAPGARLQADFHPASAEDEAVPVRLQVEGQETLPVDGVARRVWRARLTGYASFKGPHQTPATWLGAEMDGTVWVEEASGLMLQARLDCIYPTYALWRDPVSTPAGL